MCEECECCAPLNEIRKAMEPFTFLGGDTIMALLSKDEIFSKSDIVTEDVECPEWGGTVRVRSLSGIEREDFEASVSDMRNPNKPKLNLKNMRARLIVMSAIKEDGSPMFDRGDVMRLSQKSAAPLDRLFEACQRLSGLSDGDVESLTEDFDGDQSESSTSDSHSL